MKHRIPMLPNFETSSVHETRDNVGTNLLDNLCAVFDSVLCLRDS